MGVGLLGLGGVGSGVAQYLTQHAPRAHGLTLHRALVRDLRKPRPVATPEGLLTSTLDGVLEDPRVRIVVEVMGGEHPALEYISEALSQGRHVVTANKEVMAKHGSELLDLASRKGVQLRFEASVGGGIPIIGPLQRDLRANEITSIRAIINGTTNYILTRMDREGLDFNAALEAAQKLGYAEPDPSSDVQGTDAAYKLAILASLAFRTRVDFSDVHHEGITRLQARDFRYARELGYAIKLLAIGRLDDAAVQVRVHPVMLPIETPLAKVEGAYNAIEVQGDLVGSVVFSGQGAGTWPTTSAIIGDVLDIARHAATARKRAPGGTAVRSRGNLERQKAGHQAYFPSLHPVLHSPQRTGPVWRPGPDRPRPGGQQHQHRLRNPEGRRPRGGNGGAGHHDSPRPGGRAPGVVEAAPEPRGHHGAEQSRSHRRRLGPAVREAAQTGSR